MHLDVSGFNALVNACDYRLSTGMFVFADRYEVKLISYFLVDILYQ